MPTYSYRCTACQDAFDIQQAFSDDALTTCEKCGGSLRKLFSAVGVTFQGSGFYRTDSRKEATNTSSASSGDSKPAATPAKESSSAPATAS